MCELAAERTSNWLMVDSWEAMQPEYVPTAKVLDHFEAELSRVLGEGVESADGTQRLKPRIAVLAGADLIQTMSTPGVWDPKDLDHILGKFGVFIVERAGTDMDQALFTLQQWQHNIYVIQQVFQNNMSSTQVRLHLKRDMSVRYLIPEVVIDYIEEQGLYQTEGGAGNGGEVKGKERDSSAAAASSKG
jgi:nicotinamide mononucleotide adenylyltransferase